MNETHQRIAGVLHKKLARRNLEDHPATRSVRNVMSATAPSHFRLNGCPVLALARKPPCSYCQTPEMKSSRSHALKPSLYPHAVFFPSSPLLTLSCAFWQIGKTKFLQSFLLPQQLPRNFVPMGKRRPAIAALIVACLAVALPAVAEEQELNCFGEAIPGVREGAACACL